MDQVLLGNRDTESNVAMVCLGWHLEGEAMILHSSFRKNPAIKDIGITPLLIELRQFYIPFINKDQLQTEFQANEQTHNGRARPIQ